MGWVVPYLRGMAGEGIGRVRRRSGGCRRAREISGIEVPLRHLGQFLETKAPASQRRLLHSRECRHMPLQS